MARNPSLDLYAVLGVHPSAEDIVIRAAFKALAQRYHPDRFNGSMEEAHRRMADLTNAYETLADPARRRKYDRRRGHAGRTAMFYFKNPAREHPLRFGALAARAAAAKQRRYRMAVYALMVAVVILSAFNLHQHSAQLRELFTGNHGIPATAADTTFRNRPDVPPPEASTPIGPAPTTRPIGQNAAGATAQAIPGTAPAATPEARPPASATKVPAQPAVAESSKAAVAIIAAPGPVEIAHKDAKRPALKAANPKTVASDRPLASPAVSSPAVATPPVANAPAPPPTAPSPVANDAGECKAAVAALGLCNRN